MRKLLIFAFLVSAEAAADMQDKAALEQVAEAFARSHTSDLPGKVEISYKKLDEHLRLPLCPQPAAFLPAGSRLWGNTSIGLHCAAPAWTVFVSMTIKVIAPIAVTARPLANGHVIAEGDLIMRNSDITQLPGNILTDLRPALGTRLKSNLPADYPIRTEMLHASMTLNAGQKVKLLVKGQGFRVNAEGTALSSAITGQSINVRTTSGKIVSGIVQPDGTVEVSN